MTTAPKNLTARSRSVAGFTLVELMIALAIGAILTTGILRVVQAASAGFRVQQGIGALQETARFSLGMMRRDIAQAGFRPEPWLPDNDLQALGAGTADDVTPHSDRISTRRLSSHNCFDNDNPVLDSDGLPKYYLRETTYSADITGKLWQTCRYGPDDGELVTQINHLGLVENIEAFQLLFAEDLDGDGSANRWVRAGQWQDKAGVLAVQLAILTAGAEPLTQPSVQSFRVLDQQIQAGADGRLRAVFQTTVAIQGRLK